jgi:hypothetical protein
MNGNVAEIQANILFWIIIALFAWQGYQRGIWSELTKMAFIAAGFMLGSPEYLGKTLVKAINGFYMAFQFLFHGGLEAIATGHFDADTLSKIFEEIAQIPKPISENNMELALFLVMLFLIGIGYLVSKLFKKNTMPGLGLVAGAINGFLLSYIFLPLLPDKPPFTMDDFSLMGIINQIIALIGYIIEVIIKAIAAIFNFMIGIFGAWTIPILILLIIVITLSSLARSKKKSSASQGGGSS